MHFRLAIRQFPQGLNEFKAIALLEMEIDGIAILPFLIEKEAPGLEGIFVEPIVEAARFAPRKFYLSFRNIEEWLPVLVGNFHAARDDDHMASRILDFGKRKPAHHWYDARVFSQSGQIIEPELPRRPSTSDRHLSWTCR